MENQQQENGPIQNQAAENLQPSPHKPDKKLVAVVIAIIVLLIAGVAIGAYYWWQTIGGSSQRACTMEAKLCPDGSSVGRIGPNCEFAECPEDVSAGWQTYKNEQYGFEFKYPKEWELKENNQIISFTAPANLIGKGNQLASIKPEIVINRDKGSYRNLEDFLSKWEYNDSDLSALWNISNIAYKEINGSRFFYYEYYHQVKGFVFLTIKDGDLVQIKFIDETGQNGNFLSAYGDFVKLISTFKFIEPIDTSTWQTYRNEEYGFEVKYPQDWELIKFNDDPNPISFRKMLDDIDSYDISITRESRLHNHGMSLEQWVSINQRGTQADVFNGLPAFSLSRQNAQNYLGRIPYEIDIKEIYIANYDYYFKLRVPVNIVHNNFNQSSAELINQILSTFKFIPTSYTFCGCGCCGGVEPESKCLFQSKGNYIQEFIIQDEVAAEKTDCSNVGCSRGIKYIYCD